MLTRVLFCTGDASGDGGIDRQAVTWGPWYLGLSIGLT